MTRCMENRAALLLGVGIVVVASIAAGRAVWDVVVWVMEMVR